MPVPIIENEFRNDSRGPAAWVVLVKENESVIIKMSAKRPRVRVRSI